MRVSAIIPAFNEEKTIINVLTAVIACPEIDEIVVVSDGSTDQTADLVRQTTAKLIELDVNVGKGGAMKEGVNNSQGEIIIFLDADLIGLTVEHLQNMLAPVVANECDMVIGIFENGRLTTDLAQKMSPFLSGQRVVKRSILDGLDNMEMTKFGIEVALTQHARSSNISWKGVTLKNMSHVMKEEKLGLFRGFMYRLKMYWEIIIILLRRYSSLK